MKKTFKLMLLLAMSFALFACGDKDEADEDEVSLATVYEEGDVNLTFMMWGSPKEKAAVYEVLSDFQQANPSTSGDYETAVGIQVVHTDSLNYPDKLLAMYAGGEAPDVFYLFVEDFYRYASSGDLYPLDDFVTTEEFDLEDFYPDLVEKFMYGGSYFGVPKDWTSFVMYYNMDLFDAAGLPYPDGSWDWDEFLETAIALTVDEDGDGAVDQFGFLVEKWANWYYNWIKQAGGEIFDDNGEWVFADAKYLDANSRAIQFVADLVNVYGVSPSVENAQQMGSEEAFINQQTAMCMYGRWVQLKFRDIKDFRWNYAPLPHDEEVASVITTTALSISRDTAYPEEAWMLLDYITSYEGQIATAEFGLAVPSRKSLIESDHYLKAPDVIKFQDHLALDSSDEDPFIQAMENGCYIAKNAQFLEVRQKVDEQIEDVFYGLEDAKSKILTIDTMVSEILGGELEVQLMEGDEE